ncbi:hypothetical protein E2C01_060195 [Portunus trituberculatus]|uniref:Uncharacterized protein n=1 Tax=Portunus trituberculatus TaxID=210409 RepID=A0A5B7H4K9_PORTR|nr:hypothetical protein [Portunus trituberculatus]
MEISTFYKDGNNLPFIPTQKGVRLRTLYCLVHHFKDIGLENQSLYNAKAIVIIAEVRPPTRRIHSRRMRLWQVRI